MNNEVALAFPGPILTTKGTVLIDVFNLLFHTKLRGAVPGTAVPRIRNYNEMKENINPLVSSPKMLSSCGGSRGMCLRVLTSENRIHKKSNGPGYRSLAIVGTMMVTGP